MTRNVKVFLSLFLVFCMLSVFATVALAEPEDTSSPVDTSSETVTDTPSESTPTEETRKVSLSGDLLGVLVYFNGANGPATEFQAPVNQTLNFRVEPLEGYQVNSVKLFGYMNLTPDSNGVYSLDITSDDIVYEIRISATFVGVTSSGDPSSSDTPSDPSSDDPTPSDDPSSDVSGGGESSGTSTEEPMNTADLRVTISGAGTVTANGASVSASGSAVTETLQLEVDVATTVTIAPAYGYKMTSLKIDGNVHALDESITLTINELTTLEVTFEPDTVAPTTYQVIVSCATAGGYVSAGGYTVTSGNATTISVEAGGSLTISVFPADGYEVDAFRVGGAAQNLSEGTYELTNIASNATVTVSFKAVTTQIVPVEADDFVWTANADGNIVIDLGNNTYIGKSVFDKINTLTEADGSYVVLKTSYIHWYIPCGGVVANVPENYLHLSVALNANGSYYATIEASILASDPDTVFQYYELSESPEFPAGTYASFNLAGMNSAYAGSGVDLMAKITGTDGKTSLKVVGTGTVESTGWTSKIPYQNSRNLVVRVNVSKTYNITASAGSNGSITPSGTNSVSLLGDMSFTVTASSGYIISAVYVDGAAVAGAAGQNSFVYTFEDVSKNGSIRAEFIPSGSDYVITGNIAVIQGNVSDTSDSDVGRSHTGLIVALIIIFVAIAGAAALFIVKWRQEKF